MEPVTSTSTLPDQAPMTSTAQQVVSDQNQPTEKPADTTPPHIKKRNEEFRERIESCKLYRRKLIANWTISIDYRRGKPFSSQTDEDQVSVNLDWTLTKAKQASLFSQVPKVRVDHPPETLKLPWIETFESRLNDTLVEAGIETAMDEVLPDCINAAGIGVVVVSYESISEDRQLPTHDPSMAQPGQDQQMETVPQILDHRYVIERISPSDLLWNIGYTGSNFDKAPWIGRSGRITWSQAQRQFGLKESDKEVVVGENKPILDRLTHDVERNQVKADETVGFDEIFYKEFQYADDATSYNAIHHLVFVSGKEKPVIDEIWKGQRVNPDGTIIGAKRFPIRLLTLSYITDEAIPPSDSAIGRPQVNELNQARTQMIRQRQRSLPVRWADVNRVDPLIMQNMMRGTWQQFIPVQGDGTRIIGEVSRAQMPQENFMFDKIAKSDLNESWAVGFGVDPTNISSGNPDQPQPILASISGRERAKVVAFVNSIAEVLGGLMCLYEDPASLGQGFDPSVSTKLCYSILADSTVLLDANQKIQRLTQFVNNYAKSGYVNLEPVMREIASLAGLDPNIVIQAPGPKPPVEPNISLRLTGLEDLLNPLSLAFLIKSGQAPPPQLIEQAKNLIQQAVVPPQPPQGPPQEGQGGPVAPGTPPGAPTPNPPPTAPGDANPKMTVMPQVNTRSDSRGNQ